MIYSHLPYLSSRYDTPEVVGNPRVLSAYGQGLSILVAFSHEIDTHDVNTPNPAFYVLTNTAGTAATVTAVVETDNPQVLLLEVDGLTEGGVYVLTVGAIKALNGLPVVAPNDQATVLGSTEPLSLTVTPQTSGLVQVVSSRPFDTATLSVSDWTFSTAYPATIVGLSQEIITDNAVNIRVQEQTSVGYSVALGGEPDKTLADLTGTLSIANNVVSGLGYLRHIPNLSGLAHTLAEVVVDLTGAVWSSQPVGTDWSVQWLDGAYQQEVRFGWDGASQVISWWSNGAQIGSTLSWTWKESAFILRLVRSPLGRVSVHLNGEALWSAALGDVSPTVTCSLRLDVQVSVSGFVLSKASVWGSNTVLTLWQNLVFGLTGSFSGIPSASFSNVIHTGKGPLCRVDNALEVSRPSDVVVTVAGQPVTVTSVEAHTGTITLDVPVPAGQPVSVDYWYADRAKFSWTLGQQALGPASPHPGSLSFGQRMPRFPQQIRLGSVSREQPQRISHRLIAFLQSQSDLLGKLPLGGSPNRHTTNPRNLFPRPQTVSRDSLPLGWTSLGNPSAVLNSEGKVSLTGSGWYLHPVQETGSTSVQVVSRMSCNLPPSRGCWTGVGFGYRGQRWVSLVGLLEVQGVRHVGLLKDWAMVEQEQAWDFGFQRTLVATSQTSVACAFLPLWFVAGSRFRVLTSSQAGTYTVTSREGDVLTISPSLPANVNLFGNRDLDTVLEIDWQESYSYRLQVNSDTGVQQVLIGGSADVVVSAVAPTSESLSLPRTPSVFWGHGFESSSTWTHTRATITTFPPGVPFNGNYVEMNGSVTPDLEAQAWSPLGQWGRAISDGVEVTIQSRGGVEQALSYPYNRVEPFLTSQMFWDLRMGVQANADGGLLLLVRNGRSIAALGAILYREDAGVRSLVRLPVVSTSGYLLPEAMGFGSGADTVDVWRDGRVLVQSNRGDQPKMWSKPLAWHLGQGTRQILVRFRSDTPGIKFGVRDGLSSGEQRDWSVRFDHNGVAETVSLWGTTHLQTVVMPWTAVWHDLQLVADGVNATVFLDGVQILQQGYGANPPVANYVASETGVSFGTSSRPANETVVLEMEWFIAQALLEGSELRTLGLWQGGDPDSLSSWKLAGAGETDPTLAANPITPMDWTASLDIRVLHDPTWGLQVQRPDLAMPGAGQDATPVITPGEGWINLERMPDIASAPSRWVPGSTLGDITFGQGDGSYVGDSVWRYLHYRIFRDPESVLVKRSLNLGQGSPITNGVPSVDRTPEIVELTVQGGKLLLSDRGIWAQRIYRILDGGVALSSASWSFDRKTQQVTVNTAASVLTVIFSPKAPFGVPYLTAQPIEMGDVLGEGTPPFWADQYGPAATATWTTTDIINQQIVGTPALDPADPYRVRVRQETKPLAGVTTIQKSDGVLGLVASVDDRDGVQAVGLSGYQDTLFIPGSPYPQTSIFVASGGSFYGGHVGPGTMVCFPVGNFVTTSSQILDWAEDLPDVSDSSPVFDFVP